MEIDWSQAPKTARWWAIDCSGKAHWFVAPNVAAFTDFWFAEPKPAPNFGFIGDWRKSLVERPGQADEHSKIAGGQSDEGPNRMGATAPKAALRR